LIERLFMGSSEVTMTTRDWRRVLLHLRR